MSLTSTLQFTAPYARTRYPLLGSWVNALSLDELTTAVAECIDRGERWIIAHHNMNSMALMHRDSIMADFYRKATLIHVDGMPLIWIGRVLGLPVRPCHRVTYVDWTLPLMTAASARGWRVFYLGGRPGVADRAAGILRNAVPGLHLHTHHGWFDTEPSGPENQRVLAEIASRRPHLLLVGMGMPRQERWIGRHLDELDVNAILPCGAAFDYVAKEIHTPPRWAGRIGAEWAFRLAAEPGRLWRRYLLEPWFVLSLVAREAFSVGRSKSVLRRETDAALPLTVGDIGDAGGSAKQTRSTASHER